MLIGYARVSTARQRESLDTQRDALLAVGCDRTHFFSDTVSGSKWERPGLKKALSYMRAGDTLVVTCLDHLGRSVRETVTTTADLAERDINVRMLEPALDTSKPPTRLSSTSWPRSQSGSATCSLPARRRASHTHAPRDECVVALGH